MKDFYTVVYRKFEDIIKSPLNSSDLLEKVARLLHTDVPHYDWVGFYILDSIHNELVLGPFAGAPTEHTRIGIGKGICGQVAESKSKMIIQDVSDQENYLSCSIDVQSEIVIPILKDGIFLAEIDIDSHAYSPFTEDDERLLEYIAMRLVQFI